MPVAGILNSHDPALERFLYASVGEDRNGSSVTVLSALARLDLDPWDVAAELASSGRRAAVSRLGKLLSRSIDVPALATENGEVARSLAALLPGAAPAATSFSDALHKGVAFSPGAVLSVTLVILILIQILFSGTWETAE
ncbi:hypothetical protein [Sedimentimonas flavescens]|uniref:hypothetical protein n=1 Tax=Sedimentimonas flavescens TaxID=2851012 RepID=UPI001C4A50D2|nr:hypothetical protein [Sedimentimonas flavescens]MBW0159380.1 hypothetical protein [Sedimentimonas flavescens]